MGVLRSLVERRATLTLDNADEWFARVFKGSKTHAGVDVSESSGMRFSAVWACLRVISEDVATLPLFVFERLSGGGKQRAEDHYLHLLVHDQANPRMTALALRETVTAHILSWGNGYLYIVTDNGGRPIELWPLLPDRTWPWWTSTGELAYWTEIPSARPEPKLLRNDQVIHLAGLSYDGLVGYSPIRTHAQAIGAGLAAQEFGARFFGQGTNMGGFVEHPQSMSDPAYARLKADINEQYQGLGRSHLITILEEGAKFNKLTIPPNEAQFLESRQFSVEEIARIYRMPPHKIGHLLRMTFNNVEQMDLDYYKSTLRPWLLRWEKALAMKLLPAAERRRFFIEHVIEGLLRGDIKTRYDAYSTGRQWGWLSADDVRELENMNPLPDGQGKKYLIPLNMVPADRPFDDDEDDDEPGDDPPPPDDERASRYRRRVARAFRPIFAEADRRAVRRERARIFEQVRRRGNDLERWLETFYGEDHRSFIEERFAPAFAGLAVATTEAVAEEMGVGLETLRLGLDELARGLVGSFAQRHATESLRVIKEALAAGGDPFGTLELLFASWVQDRPAVTAARETEEASEAVARAARRSYEPAPPAA